MYATYPRQAETQEESGTYPSCGKPAKFKPLPSIRPLPDAFSYHRLWGRSRKFRPLLSEGAVF
jgi:hypothetical protein